MDSSTAFIEGLEIGWLIDWLSFVKEDVMCDKFVHLTHPQTLSTPVLAPSNPTLTFGWQGEGSRTVA